MIVNQIVGSDAHTYLSSLPAAMVDCIVTSPPYFGLRDYGIADQIGKENSPGEYIANLVRIFTEAKRVLKNTGTLWLNLGDSYSTSGGRRSSDTGISRMSKDGIQKGGKAYKGFPSKSLMLIPTRVAIALQDDNWLLRSKIIWYKPNCMPFSGKDRPTSSYEEIFLFAKKPSYFYNLAAGRTPVKPESEARLKRGVSGGHKYTDGAGGQRSHTMHQARPNDGNRVIADSANLRDVWTIATSKYEGGHFATMPLALAERMVLLGCPRGGVVLDPFMGAGTTALAAVKHGRGYLGSEINPAYLAEAMRRLAVGVPVSLFDMPVMEAGNEPANSI